jgi:hypothetical protein
MGGFGRVVAIVSLLVLPALAHAEPSAYIGLEAVSSQINDSFFGLDPMVVGGAEFRSPSGLALGIGIAVRDTDHNDDDDYYGDELYDGVFMKTDLYLRYDFFPREAISPFVAAGVTMAWLTTYRCANEFDCISDDFGSSGTSYRVGVAMNVDTDQKLNIFYSRYLGTDNVTMDMLGVSAQF